jgi:hypothetical protein
MEALALAEAPIETAPIDPVYIRGLEGFPPLTDSELVEQVIAFANTGSARAYGLIFTSVRLSEPMLAMFEGHAEREEASSKVAGGRLPLKDREQNALRAELSCIVAGKVTAAIHDMWRRRASGLALLPQFAADGTRGFRYVAFETYALSPQPQLAYALLLFLTAPFVGELCRCKLEGCGRFFLAVRPSGGRGRIIRDYCPDTDHRECANQADAVRRMRDSRARARARKQSKQAKQRRR